MRPQFLTWRASKWDQFLNSLYQVPIGIADTERTILILYGKMFLEDFREAKGQSLKKLSTGEALLDDILEHPEQELPTVAETIRSEQAQAPKMRVFDEHFGTEAEFVKAEPVNTDHEAAFQKALAPAQPLTEQPKAEVIKQLKVEDSLANGGQTISAEQANATLAGLERIRDNAEDPMKQKWATAEAIARSTAPPLGPAGMQDTELVTMVQYCEFWIREVGAVPHGDNLDEAPNPVVDIYWERPKTIDNAEQTLARRKTMVERVLAAWKDITAKNGHKMDLEYDGLSEYDTTVNAQAVYNEFDRCLRVGRVKVSYRVVQAAIALQRAVETFATAWRLDSQPNRISDEDLTNNLVKDAIRVYYKAHLPLKEEVGPKETMDPDYLTYRLLCRKYKLTPGQFLHEVLTKAGQ